jgi:hypothetical protein
MGGGITLLVAAGTAEVVVVEMLVGIATTEVMAERNERLARSFIATRSVANESPRQRYRWWNNDLL